MKIKTENAVTCTICQNAAHLYNNGEYICTADDSHRATIMFGAFEILPMKPEKSDNEHNNTTNS
jgi:hypothetical protein